MIEGSLYPNWGTVFSVLLTVVIATCYHVLLWRPAKKTKAMEPKKSLTIRIKRVRIDKSRDDLQRELTSIIEADPNLNQDAITVKTHSIVPWDQKEAYATATFHTSIPRNNMMKQLCKAGANLPYRFDDTFQGITPLYEASGGADVE